MEEILVQNAQTFASQHELQLAERLGFGIHRIIFAAALDIHMVDVSPSNIAFLD